MSLKSIEMQVALPRTQELGKMQEQKNQRVMINQHLDAEEKKLQATLERHKTAKTKGMQQRRVGDEDQTKDQRRERHNQKGSKKPRAQDTLHPFKGKHIDLSL